MSSARFIFTNLFLIPKSISQPSIISQQIRQLSNTTINYCANDTSESKSDSTVRILTDKEKSLDRTKIIPVEISVKYLASEAYQQTYGNHPVWEQYRRNFKGGFAPRKTRKLCIRAGVISTGNPCPICRDEYLILNYRNLDLLKQFISPHSGQILSYSKTGICQQKHKELLVAVERARDYGLLTFDVPFREFNYSEYYGEEAVKKLTEQQ